MILINAILAIIVALIIAIPLYLIVWPFLHTRWIAFNTWRVFRRIYNTQIQQTSANIEYLKDIKRSRDAAWDLFWSWES